MNRPDAASGAGRMALARATGVAILALCSLGFLGSCKVSRAPSAVSVPQPVPSGPLAPIAQQLQDREGMLESAAGEFLLETAHNKEPKYLAYLSEKYGTRSSASNSKPYEAAKLTWAFQGERFRQEEVQMNVGADGTPLGERPDSLVIHAFDGGYGYAYAPATGQATKVAAARVRSSGLTGWVGWWLNMDFKYGGRSLRERLIEKGATVVGRETVDGVDCYHLTAPTDPSGNRYSWWLATDGFLIPVREETVHTLSESGAREVAEATGFFETAPGIWTPRSIIRTSSLTLPDGTEIWTRRECLSVVSLEVNQPIDPDVFRIRFPFGTKVEVVRTPRP